MQIEPLRDEEEWDAFCRAQPSAFFWHTTDWVAYQLHARPGGENLHFTVREGKELLAVVPLVREGTTFTLSGAPTWGPAIRADLPEARALEVARAAFEHVDALAAGATRAAFQLSPLTAGNEIVCAAAIRAGYLDISRTSQVLDLTAGPDRLRKEMSKGHRAATKKGVARFEVQALAGTEALHRFRAMHEAAAGRATRPPETYDRWAEWAQRGEGIVLLTEAGGSFLTVFGDRAYYMAAAMDRSRSHEPVGHALQWAAIEWLIAHGVTVYELGIQQFGPLPHDVPDEKERNISRFKRGFGGVTRRAPAYEKWYDAGAFRAEHARRIEAYALALAASGP
jgi:hypothetical protein